MKRPRTTVKPVRVEELAWLERKSEPQPTLTRTTGGAYGAVPLKPRPSSFSVRKEDQDREFVEITLDIGHSALGHIHISNGHEFPEIIFWGDDWLRGESWHVARMNENEEWDLGSAEAVRDVDILRYVPRSLHGWLRRVSSEDPVPL
jgi:hypothetical protein